MKNLIPFLFILSLFFVACSDNDERLVDACPDGLENCFSAVDAIIVWEGNPDADGCGFVLKVGDDRFHPENLTDEYAIEDLEVSVTYNVLSVNGPHCWASLQAVSIIDIEKQ